MTPRVDDPRESLLMLSTSVPESGVAVVTVAGECDLHDAERLERELVAAGAGHTLQVRADLSGLRFLDSSALQALLAANRLLRETGIELVLVEPSAEVRRTLEVTGVADRFDIVARRPPIYRFVNERILELSQDWEVDEQVHFVCECPRGDCTRPVPLRRDEFERIRGAHEPRLLLHPRHADEGWTVVEADDAHLVVRAMAPPAGRR